MKKSWIPHRFHRLEGTFLARTRFCLGETPRSGFEPDPVGVRTDPSQFLERKALPSTLSPKLPQNALAN